MFAGIRYFLRTRNQQHYDVQPSQEDVGEAVCGSGRKNDF